MFYRIRIDLAFTNPGVYTGLVQHAEGIISQALIINPDEPNEERGFILLEKCYHDESPNKPCELISVSWVTP